MRGRAVRVCPFVCLCLMTGMPVQGAAGQSSFFREHWARFDPNVSNYEEPRWRINDEQVSLDPRFGTRWEARANGLILIDVPEDLFALERAELYLELWGGHRRLENKRFTLNGKGTYPLPEVGARPARRAVPGDPGRPEDPQARGQHDPPAQRHEASRHRGLPAGAGAGRASEVAVTPPPEAHG